MDYTPQYLINLTRKDSFPIGPYLVKSQQPDVVSEDLRRQSAVNFLPAFIALWHDIEQATGYRWKCTSYIRDSPSHSLGHSFDLAPDIAANAAAQYAVTRMSDPVLYKRLPLIKALQTLRTRQYGITPVGIFIEPDHLHLQVLQKGGGERFPTSIVLWPVAKPIYSDTIARMQLPMLRGNPGSIS